MNLLDKLNAEELLWFYDRHIPKMPEDKGIMNGFMMPLEMAKFFGDQTRAKEIETEMLEYYSSYDFDKEFNSIVSLAMLGVIDFRCRYDIFGKNIEFAENINGWLKKNYDFARKNVFFFL